MGTINSAINMMRQALQNDQAALNIVSNNVANASTTGYTEEQAAWQESASITSGNITYGQGSTVTGAVSQRDRILQERLNQQQQLYSSSSTRLTALDSIQSVFSVTTSSSSSSSSNIGTDITAFFSSFTSLEASPSSNSLRQEVLSTAQTLATGISSAASSLKEQQSSLDQEAVDVVTQVNALTTAIAQLNQQIQQSGSDSNSVNALEDQRQLDITNLSKLVGINQVSTADNGIQITTTSGQVLIAGSTSFELTTGTSGGVTHIYSGTTDLTTSLASGGGSLGGYLTARDTDIPNVLSSLDQLAYSVSTQVNALNNAGTDLAGDTSNAGNIFSEPTTVSGSALSMSVVMTDPNHIAAASSTAGTGDNSNAVAMANLAKQTIVNGQTPTNYYSNFVSSLGSTITSVDTENTANEASVTQLQTQINSISGVNLNNEASSLTLLERSYQAASQMFSILNTLMAQAINLGTETTVS